MEFDQDHEGIRLDDLRDGYSQARDPAMEQPFLQQLRMRAGWRQYALEL